MDIWQHWELLVFFFLIAAVYASAGFGGGSSYLAVLSLYAIPFTGLRATALLCNLVVVTGGTWIFYQKGHLDLKKVWPMMVLSIPMAFLGGALPLKEEVFFLLLGISLLLAGGLILLQDTGRRGMAAVRPMAPWGGGILGGGIGFFSGMVGIGGGIFLSPVLHLMRWDRPKEIAATASLFILVNSAAGLGGQLLNRKLEIDWAFTGLLLLAVLAGGQLGARLSAGWIPQRGVRWATALLTLWAGLRLVL